MVDHFGDEVPELRAFAVKILGLTCSSSPCERNWSTFNQVHTKRRNRLSTVKLNSLVFIMFNKRLKFRKSLLQKREDTLVCEALSSDDEWIVDDNTGGDDELALDVDEMNNEFRGVHVTNDMHGDDDAEADDGDGIEESLEDMDDVATMDDDRLSFE
ncbi:unnamed protein product [Cuscuta campestris]|uniref:HAT C-terminal dimerisation domain-containing protein n=1 Tax=Cuscuta campestris TaxID=132261 RepID=A0A484L496_9ASTE|nr:unnamed protein product [Cuscuta campestris]